MRDTFTFHSSVVLLIMITSSKLKVQITLDPIRLEALTTPRLNSACVETADFQLPEGLREHICLYTIKAGGRTAESSTDEGSDMERTDAVRRYCPAEVGRWQGRWRCKWQLERLEMWRWDKWVLPQQ